RIIGVSGVARLVDHYARRPQLQERMTAQIADHVEKLLRPRGVAVLLEARHLCMEMRGVRRFGRVETRAVRGALRDTPWTELWSGGRRKAGRGGRAPGGRGRAGRRLGGARGALGRPRGLGGPGRPRA